MRYAIATAAVLCLAGAQFVLHVRFDSVVLAQPVIEEEALPTERSLQLVTAGYNNIAADYYWLRALEYFGTGRANDIGYPLLEPLLRRALTLDPKFKSAYIMAGAALTLPKMDVNKSINLLRRGVVERPDVWQIGYYLGFNLYYFQQDYVAASEAMQQAARIPGAPPIVMQIATRLAAEAGRPELGIQIIDSILERTTDEQLRNTYLDRRKALQLDYEMSALEATVVRFRSERGQTPTSIQDLIDAGYLRGHPLDPYGHAYAIATDGSIVTPSSDMRLRMHKPPTR